jgi:hypothetical protein
LHAVQEGKIHAIKGEKKMTPEEWATIAYHDLGSARFRDVRFRENEVLSVFRATSTTEESISASDPQIGTKEEGKVGAAAPTTKAERK